MKTWIFAQPEATGSNGWAGKAIVAGLDITSVDRAPAFYEDDARLIADAPRLKEENEQLKLQLSKEREQCATIASMFTMKADRSLHPDIPWDQLSEQARAIAHTTAQQIAHEIRHQTGKQLPKMEGQTRL